MIFLLSPACNAQSEIAPDHFDGTDSWATVTQEVAAPKLQRTLAALQANHRQEPATSSRLATNHPSTVPHKSAPAILSTRKATALKAGEQNRRHQRN